MELKHQTLGDLISKLETIHKEDGYAMIACDNSVGSYRGHYEQMYISPCEASTPLAEVLLTLRGAVGFSFEDYKGGSYTMDAETPMWLSGYGTTGSMIVGVTHDVSTGVVEFITCKESWN